MNQQERSFILAQAGGEELSAVPVNATPAQAARLYVQTLLDAVTSGIDSIDAASADEIIVAAGATATEFVADFQSLQAAIRA